MLSYPSMRAAIQRHTIVLPVRAGSGYVLNNHRWLHGRRGFDGPRLMYRIIANPPPGSVLLASTRRMPRMGASGNSIQPASGCREPG